jgi:CubicO group peptidase (beta-lactamase class C family)
MTALDLTSAWPVGAVAAAVIAGDHVVSTAGDLDRVFELASVTKPLSAWAALVAVEEGVIALDQPAGQPGCTFRHLLAHAGGYGFDGLEPISKPERTRGYSNAGFEILGLEVHAASAITFADYLHEAVFEPLGMTSSGLFGSPAHRARSTVSDLIAFVAEVRSPRLLTAATATDAVTVQYPSLGGIVPGVGRYTECPWGLGFEIRGTKAPHWTGALNAPATHGHFGGAGTMFWIDPDADVALVALTDTSFGDWSLEAWPAVSDAVLTEFGRADRQPTGVAP